MKIFDWKFWDRHTIWYKFWDFPWYLLFSTLLFGTNVNGMWYVLKYGIKLMIDSGNGGRIVNNGSLTGITGTPFYKLHKNHIKFFTDYRNSQKTITVHDALRLLSSQFSKNSKNRKVLAPGTVVIYSLKNGVRVWGTYWWKWLWGDQICYYWNDHVGRHWIRKRKYSSKYYCSCGYRNRYDKGVF